MSSKSKIEWTDSSWNPVTGCDPVSTGCKNCYAETFAERFRGVAGHPYEQGFDLKLWPERLDLPLTWKKPRMIFVNSMSDLFHDKIPLVYIRQVFNIMERAYWHHFQILTKRAERLVELAPKLSWPENVWMGVSVETERYLTRIDCLRQVPSSIRFLSLEPLLGPLHDIDLTSIDWCILGGESGHSARRMYPEWARDVRDQCVAAAVPLFFKQWGNYNDKGQRVGKKRSGRILDGRTWDQMPIEQLMMATA